MTRLCILPRFSGESLGEGILRGSLAFSLIYKIEYWEILPERVWEVNDVMLICVCAKLMVNIVLLVMYTGDHRMQRIALLDTASSFSC